MHLYNKKIGFYNHYYNMTFVSYLKSYNFLSDNLYNNNITSCLIIYPILYKKLSFFRFSCSILKKKKMKSRYNINQTVILEGFISRNKCFLSIPVFSFVNNLKVY